MPDNALSTILTFGKNVFTLGKVIHLYFWKSNSKPYLEESKAIQGFLKSSEDFLIAYKYGSL